MSDLASEIVSTLDELSVAGDTGADPGAAGQVDHVCAIRVRTEGVFGECACVAIVVECNRTTGQIADHIHDRHVLPCRVVGWFQKDAALHVQWSGS